MRKSRLLRYVSLILVLILTQSFVFGQGIPIECGNIIEADFDSIPSRTVYPGELYTIELVSGDQLEIKLTPLVDIAAVAIAVLDPNNVRIYWSNLVHNAKGESDLLSDVIAPSPGIYTIHASADIESPYLLELGCMLRDGTVVEPGDVAPPPTIESSSTLSLFDYLGLSDLIANGVVVPLQADVPNAGSIATGFDGVFGYSFAAEAGQSMTLNFARTAGNLNLGVVLLSADNQVAFLATLVTSNTLSTELTIPASGEYTLGVFRIELIPPDAPENTTFTLSASLN